MEVAVLCENLHCLPDAGGLMDQDPYWISRLLLVYEARGAQAKLEKARAEAKNKGK